MARIPSRRRQRVRPIRFHQPIFDWLETRLPPNDLLAFSAAGAVAALPLLALPDAQADSGQIRLLPDSREPRESGHETAWNETPSEARRSSETSRKSDPGKIDHTADLALGLDGDLGLPWLDGLFPTPHKRPDHAARPLQSRDIEIAGNAGDIDHSARSRQSTAAPLPNEPAANERFSPINLRANVGASESADGSPAATQSTTSAGDKTVQATNLNEYLQSRNLEVRSAPVQVAATHRPAVAFPGGQVAVHQLDSLSVKVTNCDNLSYRSASSYVIGNAGGRGGANLGTQYIVGTVAGDGLVMRIPSAGACSAIAVDGGADPVQFNDVHATATGVVVVGTIDTAAGDVGLFARLDPTTLAVTGGVWGYSGTDLDVRLNTTGVRLLPSNQEIFLSGDLLDKSSGIQFTFNAKWDGLLTAEAAPQVNYTYLDLATGTVPVNCVTNGVDADDLANSYLAIACDETGSPTAGWTNVFARLNAAHASTADLLYAATLSDGAFTAMPAGNLGARLLGGSDPASGVRTVGSFELTSVNPGFLSSLNVKWTDLSNPAGPTHTGGFWYVLGADFYGEDVAIQDPMDAALAQEYVATSIGVAGDHGGFVVEYDDGFAAVVNGYGFDAVGTEERAYGVDTYAGAGGTPIFLAGSNGGDLGAGLNCDSSYNGGLDGWGGTFTQSSGVLDGGLSQFTYSDNRGSPPSLPSPPPIPSCEVCEDTLIQSAVGACGSPGSCASEGPVRYFDGTITGLTTTDLSSDGFGTAWGHTRSWSNHPGYAGNQGNGSGSTLTQLPFLVEVGTNGTVAVVLNGSTSIYFDLVGFSYVPRFFSKEKLEYNAGAREFTLTDTTGNRLVFDDFSHLLVDQKGQLKRFLDSGNKLTTISRFESGSDGGKVSEVQRTDTTTGIPVTESYAYTYSGGMISSVQLRRGPPSPNENWTVVRKVEYVYYGNELHGNPGDLKKAIIKDGESPANILETKYYRYYKLGDANGYDRGLKYLFHDTSYARLAAAYPNPETATDAQVAPYADMYFEYDNMRRVTKETVQGTGCSSCTGGLGTFTFSYGIPSSNDESHNSWRMRTVETLPDGNQHIVYTNPHGQIMLKIFLETSTGRKWMTFHQYDEDGRLLLTANPSAITKYDDTKPDLLNNQNGDYQHLENATGLIERRAYYASGPAAGYFQEVTLGRGEFGTEVKQRSVTYTTQTGGGVTVVIVAAETIYRNDNGSDDQTTNYAYTFFPGTTQMESRTVTHPVVAPSQNGPGTADEETSFFDTYGREIERMDGDGFIHHTEYDPATSAVVKTIQDVNGLHLITEMEVDPLGRATKLTDPNQNVTYLVYNDAAHEKRVYPGWQTGTNEPIGPTQVTREDWLGGYTEMLTLSNPPVVSDGRPTINQPPIDMNDVETLSRSYTNLGGQVVFVDGYFNLVGLTYSTNLVLGAESQHFHRTRYAYDKRGRRNQITSPTGTVTRTDFDGLSRPTSEWVSSFITGSNGRIPFPFPIQTAAYEYDDGGIGDGNLTRSTGFPGGSVAPRVTELFYDWRNRRVAQKSGVQTSEGPDTQRPIAYVEYDNLNQIVAQEQYDGDGVTFTIGANGVPNRPAANLMRARSATAYDDRGRVFRTQVYSVDQNDGTVSPTALTADTWYDHRGNPIKTANPGGLVTKYEYDGVERPIRVFATDGGGDSTWEDADDVANDLVLEQTESAYDKNGNAILTNSRMRFHDTSATGELDNAVSRSNYVAYYYDAANRTLATVNVGSNGGATYERPATIPPGTDSILVTRFGYNDAGWVETITDPKDIDAKTFYDALGRTIKTVEAYTDGDPTASTDRTTEFTYDGSNHVLTQKAVLPQGAFQTTQYIYGARTATGSTINNNDLLVAIRYPDKVTGLPSATEQELFTYNARGEVRTKRDRNGNVHTYSYDVVGRRTADAVTTLGAGVDGQVRRAEIAYDTAGRAARYTNFNAATGGSVVNEVFQDYNGLGQLVTEYQSHAGTVDTGTTPNVQYAYSEMSGGANHSRLVSMTYPNGRVLNYNYAGGLDDTISRLSSMSDSSATLEAYTYLGLSTVVNRAHPQPGIDLTYIKQPGESNGDAGDQYTGLDRFGRVFDQRWIKTVDGTPTDRFEYGYDGDSNRLYRDNLVKGEFGELYHKGAAQNGDYDNLNRLTDFQRGTLDAENDDVIGTPTRTQGWTLDALGNWDDVTTDGDAEARDHNQQNQITSISDATTPGYDANGNTTVDEAGRNFVYDAWNRLVRVDGFTTVTYAYDGLNRRIREADGTSRDLFYSSIWQVLEEHEGGNLKIQYVWSPVYVDAMVLRDRDANGNAGDGLEERLYVQQDANFNVTAVISTTGIVRERYVYDPYGKPKVLAANWDPRAGKLYSWVYLHQGGRYDRVSGLYHFRNREYSPTLGRWMQVDPLTYVDGMSLYEYVRSNVPNSMDPFGLKKDPQCCLDEYKRALEEAKQAEERDIQDCENQRENDILFRLGVGSFGAGAVTWWTGRAAARTLVTRLWPILLAEGAREALEIQAKYVKCERIAADRRFNSQERARAELLDCLGGA